jgi:hypothetical protein
MNSESREAFLARLLETLAARGYRIEVTETEYSITTLVYRPDGSLAISAWKDKNDVNRTTES